MSTATMAPPEDLFDMVFDASGIAPEDLNQKSGATVNKDGKYHVLFKGIEKEKRDGQIPAVRIDMEILAGTEESQVGRMHFHRINLFKKGEAPGSLGPLSDGSKKNLLKFFANLGLITKEEVAGNASIRLPWEKLEFMQAIVEIKNEPYDEKDKTTGVLTGKKVDSFRIPYGCNVWQVGDDRVASVPKDPDALAEFTGGAGVADVSDI